MSLLFIGATTHKANTIPFLLIGLGVFLLGPLIRLRDEARQQQVVGVVGGSEQKVKWLKRAVIGCALLMAGGLIWVIAEVESLR